jgi:hypothetical protein
MTFSIPSLRLNNDSINKKIEISKKKKKRKTYFSQIGFILTSKLDSLAKSSDSYGFFIGIIGPYPILIL